jgi:hypothetical protein
MKNSLVAIASLLLLIGCSKSSEQAAQLPAEPATALALEAPSGALDARSQFDLAAAIRVIEHEGDDDDRAFALADLTTSWQGERYQWTVNFLSAFCPNEEGCHVVPFDRGGKDKDIVQGWSPELEISAEQWQRLSKACAAEEGLCQLTFEGTLSNFRISTQELTRLTFSDVSVLAVGDEVAL